MYSNTFHKNLSTVCCFSKMFHGKESLNTETNCLILLCKTVLSPLFTMN